MGIQRSFLVLHRAFLMSVHAACAGLVTCWVSPGVSIFLFTQNCVLDNALALLNKNGLTCCFARLLLVPRLDRTLTNY